MQQTLFRLQDLGGKILRQTQVSLSVFDASKRRKGVIAVHNQVFRNAKIINLIAPMSTARRRASNHDS